MHVFDFEVFKYDWLVTFKNLETGEYTDIVNNRAELERFYYRHRNDLFIGFNNKSYDNLILAGILNGENPYSISQEIIDKNTDVIRVYQRFNVRGYNLKCVDLSQDNLQSSLKQLEGYMGLSIKESSVDFNIDRPLKDSEIQEVIEYCHKDVDATESLLEVRKSYVRSKMKLVHLFGLPVNSISKTNAQLCSDVLRATKIKFNDELEYVFPPEVSINKYINILEFYSQKIDYDNVLKTDVAGIEHKLAYGGLHGALTNYHYKGEIWQIDAASYYPSLMIEYGYLSRGVFGIDRYKQVYEERIQAKNDGDYLKSDALKLVLNTTYGAMKNQYNNLYDPHMANQVCITGQLLLIDLIEKLEPYCKLVQSNTDGIMVIPYNKDKIKEELSKWEQRTRINLEVTICSEIWQKDVNNYIMEYENGEIKTKGMWFLQYHKPFKNSMRIVDRALVDYLLKGVPIVKTIYDSNDISDFQIIKKTGNTYEKTVWYKNGKQIEVNKVNRIYASKDKTLGKLYKIKYNGELEEVRKDMLSDLPENCLIDNDNEITLDQVDRSWYVSVAEKRLSKLVRR